MKLVKVSEFFLLYVSYFILRLNNLKYFVLQQKLVLVNSVALVISKARNLTIFNYHLKIDIFVRINQCKTNSN